MGKGNLLEGLRVHEVVHVTIIVEILHILTVDVCWRELLGRTECTLDYTTVDNVSKLRSYESCALTRLYMLELDDLNSYGKTVENRPET